MLASARIGDYMIGEPIEAAKGNISEDSLSETNDFVDEADVLCGQEKLNLQSVEVIAKLTIEFKRLLKPKARLTSTQNSRTICYYENKID